MSDRDVHHTLPRLVLIADGFVRGNVFQRVMEAVDEGVRWVHLRDHDAGKVLFREAAPVCVALLREQQANLLVSINTDVDQARWLDTGVHLGVRSVSVEEARTRLGAQALIGYSAHSQEAAIEAVEAGADYVFFSPIFSTNSKPGHAGVGLEALRDCCAALPKTPVFALGGIRPDRVTGCLEAGAYGVAVLSGILAMPEIRPAVRTYLAALESKT